MGDLHQQLLERGALDADATQASGATGLSRAAGSTDDLTPLRVQPGQIGATQGHSIESEALVCLDCANALCQAKPEASPEELAELRLQTKLLTERCRDLKAQLKSAKELNDFYQAELRAAKK